MYYGPFKQYVTHRVKGGRQSVIKNYLYCWDTFNIFLEVKQFCLIARLSLKKSFQYNSFNSSNQITLINQTSRIKLCHMGVWKVPSVMYHLIDPFIVFLHFVTSCNIFNIAILFYLPGHQSNSCGHRSTISNLAKVNHDVNEYIAIALVWE